MTDIKYEKQKLNMIFQSDTPALEEKVVRKHWRDTDSVTIYLSSSTWKSYLKGETRVNVTPEKIIPQNQKYIKPTALSPFLPVNKVLLNEDNADDTETTDTSVSGKDDMLHTSSDDYTEKNKWQKNYK